MSHEVGNHAPIRFSRGRTKVDNHPEIREVPDFRRFEEMVLSDRGKKKGEAWFAAPFNSDGRRCRENVQARRFLPVDLDKIDPERLPDVRMWFAKFRGFGYSTASSTPEAPRERAVLELTREATREENLRLGAALIRDLNEEFGESVVADDSVFRNEQPVFTPLRSAAAFRFDGEPLDVDVWLATAPEAAEVPQQAVAVEGRIADGTRNKTLTSFAGSMRKRGMTLGAIEAALLAENAQRCDPPLPEAEVRGIAASIGRKPAPAPIPARVAPESSGFLGAVHTARDVMNAPAREALYCIPGRIPAGLVLLAGPPKAKKSWAALQIGIARATGSAAFDAQCESCRVLYLALEDNDPRMRRRLAFFGLTPESAPQRLHFAYEWRQGDLGVGDLQKWMEQYPDTGVLIVDVLQRFRGPKDRSQGAYEADYAMMGMLHRVAAAKPGLTVLVVHHTKKGGAADPIEAASGTFGIVGAADAVIILGQRLDRDRRAVHIEGRDWESFDEDFVWEFRQGDGWHWLGTLDGDDLTERQKAIIAMAKEDGHVTPSMVAERFSITRQSAAEALQRLVSKDALYCISGQYLPTS